MKSIHNTAWAYTKGAVATLAMALGTALLMAAMAGAGSPEAGGLKPSQLQTSTNLPSLIEIKTSAVSARH